MINTQLELKLTPRINWKNSHWVILTWVCKWSGLEKANLYCFKKWCTIEVVKH